MRFMSFAATLEAFKSGEKTVTRRMGWKNLQPGDVLQAVEKSPRGLRAHERVRKIGLVRVTDVRRERLSRITRDDVRREGFGDMDPDEFVGLFCRLNDCEPDAKVTRIEFERLPQPLEVPEAPY